MKKVKIIIFVILSVAIIISAIFMVNKKFKNDTVSEEQEEIHSQKQEFSKLLNLINSQGFQAFIEDNTTDKDKENIKKELSKIENVESVTLYSKEEALNKMKEMLKNSEEILSMYEGENNIFPDSYIIKTKFKSKNIDDLEKDLQLLEEKISNIKKIEKVNTSHKTLITLYKTNQLDKYINKLEN